MRTLAQIFLGVKDDSTRSSSGRQKLASDPLTLIDRTCEAYLGQVDVPAADIEFAPQLFASLRALVAPRASQEAGPAVVNAGEFPQADPRPSPTITATIVVMTAVLIASIGIGTLTLSIALAVALGVAGYFAAGGSIGGFAPWRGVRNPRTPILEERRPAARLPEVDRIEAALRQADALLISVRDARSVELPPAVNTQFDDRFLAFLQDLAEAGSEGDGDHLVTLSCRRLPSALETIGLQFVTLNDDNQHVFVIDEITEVGRKGRVVTVRPAIMQGQRCLSRGYARRYS